MFIHGEKVCVTIVLFTNGALGKQNKEESVYVLHGKIKKS